MKTNTMTKQETKVVTNTNAIVTGANQVATGLMISMSGLVGIWGCACLISAVAKCGGLIQMAQMYAGSIGM